MKIKMQKLDIPNEIYRQMLEQAISDSPLEACGILAGKNGKVEKFYKMTNTDASRVHFMMDPAEQFSVVKDIRALEIEMLVVYHSHPETPARLSDEDYRMALTPNVIYLILSLMQPEKPVLKGFIVKDKKAMEVTVNISDD